MKKKKGDCYEANFKYFQNFDEGEGFLVHGIIRPKDKAFGHCWIESGNSVIDRTNGRLLFIKKKDYYKHFRVDKKNMKKYTQTEAITNCFGKFNHYGPWWGPNSRPKPSPKF